MKRADIKTCGYEVIKKRQNKNEDKSRGCVRNVRSGCDGTVREVFADSFNGIEGSAPVIISADSPSCGSIGWEFSSEIFSSACKGRIPDEVYLMSDENRFKKMSGVKKYRRMDTGGFFRARKKAPADTSHAISCLYGKQMNGEMKIHVNGRNAR